MDTTVLLQQKEEKLSSSPGNSSANEKPLHLELPVYSSGRLICNSLFQLPPFSLKTGGSPLVSRTCLQFCYSLSVPDCNSRSSPDEPIFYQQNNRQFLFLGSTKAMGSLLMSWRRRNRRLSRDPAGKRFLPRRNAELL